MGYEALPVLQVDIESFPEAKCLSPSEISQLLERFGSANKLAEFLGVSPSFILQNHLGAKKYKNSKQPKKSKGDL